jgi:hypothetical protein
MTNPSPICSCIVCKVEKSSKGIFSHFLHNHSSDGDSKKMKRVVYDTEIKAQQIDSLQQYASKLNQVAIEQYNLNSSKCLQCATVLLFEKRNNKFCSHSCSATHNNNKKGRKPAKITKPKTKSGTRISITCQDCKKSFLVKPGDKNRKYCSTLCSRKNTFHPNSTIKHSSVYKGYKMDSGAELYFAQQLDEHHINWIKNDGKTYFSFTYPDTKQGKYYPDFYLPDHDIWVEIKGRRYIREHDELRRMSVPTPVILLISNDFKKELPKFFQCYGPESETQTRLSC